MLDDGQELQTLTRIQEDQAEGVPGERVVRRALQHNAAALICAHSHPSGDPTPSPADQRLTDTLKSALACIDVRLIDHLVVAGSACASFAEAGLL